MGPRRRRVVWSEGARRELDDAIEFVAEHSQDRAIRLLNDILGSAESLSDLAERGRVVPERGDPAVRELVSGPFRLLYHVTPSEVVVLGLLHQRRDFDRWRGLDR